jgi:hypothetical protein
MTVDRPGRLGVRLNALIAVLLALAVVLAIALGSRALGLAQTGELGGVAVQRQPNVLAQPEIAPERVPVYECADTRGQPVYSSEPCPDGTAVARGVEVTTIELPTRRP